MFAFLSNFLQLKQIRLFSALPLEVCRIRKPYLLERLGISHGSVLIFAVPYLTPDAMRCDRNLSSYAVSRDYHLFFQNLFDELIPTFEKAFPNTRIAGFADHSPIDEVHAAALAGLGVIGENGLLITEEYSSYVFLGALFVEAELNGKATELRFCEGCGKCRASCPAQEGICLSDLTQKKGALTPDEVARLSSHPLIWGCDVCQEVCPHTAHALEYGAIYTPIPYFYEQTIPRLDWKILNGMDADTFSCRAYAWRGRAVIERNLQFTEKGDSPC